jgi:hypothetical protein
MRYVVAGYVVVLGILFLYALQLAWRRRRLVRMAERIESAVPVPDRAVAVTHPADDQ